MSEQISKGGKIGLKRSIHYGTQNIIMQKIHTYSDYEAQILDQIRQLANKFPKKSVRQLKELLEELENMDDCIRQIQKQKQKPKEEIEEEVPLSTFNMENIPIQEENKYLKQALMTLYKDYLGKIKENQQLKTRLMHAEKRIKRVQCLPNIIKQINAAEDIEEQPEQHQQQDIQVIDKQMSEIEIGKAPYSEHQVHIYEPVQVVSEQSYMT